MSDISLDWICRRIADRLEQASSKAPAQEDARGLLPLDLVGDDAFRRAIESLGVTTDSESLCLLDPHRFESQLPAKTKLTVEASLLSDHQWRRYGTGKRNDPTGAYVVELWRQRLQRLAQDLGDKTVLCLLGHSEPASDDETAICNSELASNELSTAYPISADAFITLAGSVGLFCADPPSFVRNEDKSCNRALYAFGKREYTVRFARKTDIDALERLEKLCWIPPLRASRQCLRARIENYPQGQFALERDGELKGVIYSQRIRDEADLHRCTMDDVQQLHDPVGDVVQLLAVNIHPDSQNLACGDQLLEFMLQRSSLQRGVRKIVAVTLCKDFSVKQGLAFEEGIAGPCKDCDRVLHFHHLHGAQIGPALPGYRPRDIANEGEGVLVTYDPTRRRSCAGMQSAFSASLPASTSARCGVGSVKSNIGHLEFAAGLTGVLKVVAAMAHRRLPASIHVTTVNSRMSLLDDLAVSEEIRHYPDHERSTNSTGMWQRA